MRGNFYQWQVGYTKANSSTKVQSFRRMHPMEMEWVEDIRKQCLRAGVAFFFRQRGWREEVSW